MLIFACCIVTSRREHGQSGVINFERTSCIGNRAREADPMSPVTVTNAVRVALKVRPNSLLDVCDCLSHKVGMLCVVLALGDMHRLWERWYHLMRDLCDRSTCPGA